MIAIACIAAGAMGFAIGWRGGVAWVLGGFALTVITAVLQFHLLHPEGINGLAPDLPWGAASLVLYVAGLAGGLISSLMRR